MRVDFSSSGGLEGAATELKRKASGAKAPADLSFDARSLGDAAALQDAVTLIYAQARAGRKVIVSAPRDPALRQSLRGECEIVGLSAALSDTAPAAIAEALKNCDIAIIAGEKPVAARKSSPPKNLRVAVAGLGLIGEGFAHRLANADDYRFCAALVRQPGKDRSAPHVEQVTNDLAAFLAAKPDVVIDALPDGNAGRALIAAALDRGITVISANKQALAGALDDLHARATASGATLAYSAAVGGGAPFLETVARAVSCARVRSLEATLNGTVNYILTALSKGEAFADAVRAAQEAGFAEPDPSADLSGADARAKIALLSFAAFGVEISQEKIAIEALDATRAGKIAAAGGVWRQIARLAADDSGDLSASVRFERRDNDELFANAEWEANALRLQLSDGGVVECRGKGAGRRPTVESLLADLGEIARAATIAPSPRQAVPA